MPLFKQELDEIMEKLKNNTPLSVDDYYTLCFSGYPSEYSDCFMCPYNCECDCGQEFLEH